VQLPDWNGFMHLAASCYELSGLGYIGVDLVLDQDQGPLILELNARPGLNIQIANDAGLTTRCHMVERHLAQLKKEGREESAEERVAFSQKHFAKLPDAPLSSDEANASNA
jgi:predicted ATP-grasp superfamily ATP-dependent carboligase